MTKTPLLAAAGLSLLCLAAGAQQMKPGLWEITNKMGGNPEMEQAQAKMQARMASMPPEQRKMMEDMMAKQGVRMGAGGPGGGMVIKSCVTKEMVERHQMPVQHHGNCTTTVLDKSSSGMKMKYVCTDPASTGEGQFAFQGDTGYTMKMVIHSEMRGKPTTTTMDAAGKWLGADCGDIKPVALPKK